MYIGLRWEEHRRREELKEAPEQIMGRCWAASVPGEQCLEGQKCAQQGMARADVALERHRAGEYLGTWLFGFMEDGEEEGREKGRLKEEGRREGLQGQAEGSVFVPASLEPPKS